MKRISSYRKSKILDIKVVYNGEKIIFNLASELRVNPDSINDSLKIQPNHYGFCLLMHKKLLAVVERLKMERDATYGRLFIRAKETKVMNGRPFSDDTAKAWVESHSEFKKITRDCIKAREDADIIFAAVKGFEQRKDILQSISSNIRNEK
ncbi:MAG TPA: hypothetical protein VJ279_08220 [Hanamia sp.]|jgi:hypothetical protein|nr:hypothetical protein [Hanamia sp.]